MLVIIHEAVLLLSSLCYWAFLSCSPCLSRSMSVSWASNHEPIIFPRQRRCPHTHSSTSDRALWPTLILYHPSSKPKKSSAEARDITVISWVMWDSQVQLKRQRGLSMVALNSVTAIFKFFALVTAETPQKHCRSFNKIAYISQHFGEWTLLFWLRVIKLKKKKTEKDSETYSSQGHH